jgi:hypothetical protein
MEQRELHICLPQESRLPLEREVSARFGLTASDTLPTEESQVIRLVFRCPYGTGKTRARYDAFLTWVNQHHREALSFALALHDVSPGEGFARIPLPPLEGVHTGGPFVSPDGVELWKPLDALPYPNAPRRIPTWEDEALALMAGYPCFPCNWRVEVSRGRRWLVRKVARVIHEVTLGSALTREQVLQVEQALRAFNARYWEIGDHLTVAIDPDTGEPFVLDLSNAHPMGSPTSSSVYKADDGRHFEEWVAGVTAHGDLVRLRRAARMVVSQARWALGPYGRTHRWVYSTRLAPQDVLLSGGTIPSVVYVSAQTDAEGVRTWVVVPARLDDALRTRSQLEWGWGPIEYE